MGALWPELCPKDLRKCHKWGDTYLWITRLGELKACREEGPVRSKAGKQERELDGVKHEEARDVP